ncbi:defensin-like protein [Trifolium pratense]|uniref:Defensin-like protein n=1 Tax=Trifolium pratense TaxID=57577 RepID=A0A2K3NZ29_TRIPR|nr:defensin-like protein [Trifolium pratense]
MQPTNAQTLIRIHGLAREYWRPQILFKIVGAVGCPLALDVATKKRTFDHFARILIDVDLNSNLRERILVERNDFDFYVDVEYENLPPFCHSCQIIGHSFKNCKYQNPQKNTVSLVNKRKVQPVSMPSASEPVAIASHQVVAYVDLLIEDITRDKEVRHSVLMGDVLNFEEEIFSSISGQAISARSPILVWYFLHRHCFDAVLNPRVAHDLEISGNWKDNEASDIGHKVYTDEETAAAINYLKNRSAAMEELFIDVVFKAKKKK